MKRAWRFVQGTFVDGAQKQIIFSEKSSQEIGKVYFYFIKFIFKEFLSLDDDA